MRRRTNACFLMPLLTAMMACGSGREPDSGALFSNPICDHDAATSINFHEGKYYYAQNTNGKIYLYVGGDPVEVMNAERHMICDIWKDYGLTHLWRPNLVNLDGVWYLYVTADDGNIDNHQLYVLSNKMEDPLEGEFGMTGRISTDPDDNWAIHSCVFTHNGDLYMIWSGWVTRRVFAETQCIFIARMENPWTLASERALISRPEYEWECQWVNADGSTHIAYPLFVNESPTFLCSDLTDKAYIYYSASAHWTPYTSIGELSADKDADFLNPASWTKKAAPAMKQDREAGIYGPGTPCVIPSPDGKEYYLVYKAKEREVNVPDENAKAVYMKKIEIDRRGVPTLGRPAARGEVMRRPSGTETQ